MTDPKEILQALKATLQAELRTESASDSSLAPDNAIGRLTRMEAIQAHEMSEAGKRRIRRRIVQIDRALERVDKGEYGRCTRCGDDIPEGRLEIVPESSLCVSCAARQR